MIIESFFNFISKYHHYRIASYSKNLEFDNLIDIGCHKGEFLNSFLAIKKIDKFHCFEPQKKIFRYLKKTYKNNKNIKKIKFYNFALGNKTTIKKMYISNLSSTSTLSKFDDDSLYLKIKNFLIQTNKKKEVYSFVDQKIFDNVFKKKSLKKTFLKIDVEGYEYNVLLGSKKKIGEIPYILVENHIYSQYKNNFQKVKNILLKNNFEIIKNFYFPTLHYKDVLFKNRIKK